MRLTLKNALRVLSVPVGVGFGLWTASLWVNTSNEACLQLLMCAPGPRFELWQCALFGAGAAVTLLALSLVDSLTNALRVLSVPVGVGIGLWTAQLTSIPTQCPFGAKSCIPPFLTLEPSFATWQCILFGAGAAAVLLLLSLAVARLPSARALQAS
jgi:hypothetical protein